MLLYGQFQWAVIFKSQIQSHTEYYVEKDYNNTLVLVIYLDYLALIATLSYYCVIDGIHHLSTPYIGIQK